LRYKQLGNTDLKPSVIGFGCSKIASLTTRYSAKEVSSTLEQAFDNGITFYDTADIYGQGDSERLLGKVFNKHREKVIFCSKAGLTLSAPQRLIRYIKPILRSGITHFQSTSKKTTEIREKIEQQCFEPGYIRNQIESSLQRLQTDYLDLFLLHNPPENIINNDEIFDLLDTLKSQGHIRYYGVSCRTHEDAQLCLQRPSISCLQLNLNPGNIDSAQELLTTLDNSGYGIIARECLANKETFLHEREQNSTGHSKNNLSPASWAINAVLKHNEIDVALAGMACREHLFDNLKAIEE
jgi:aryl-alcohol dehydrogenase-like predicted oxidoreductase